MPNHIEPIVLSANPETLGLLLHTLRDYVSRAGHRAGLSQRGIYNLKLAVDEVATNIVTYGYADVIGEAIITATAVLRHDRLVVVLEDSGVNFDPRSYTLPHNFDEPLENRDLGGLGIYFALTSVDEYQYDYVDGCNRNVFVMLRPEASRIENLPYQVLLFDDEKTETQNLQEMLELLRYPTTMMTRRDTILNELRKNIYDVLILGDGVYQADAIWILKHLRMVAHPPDTLILVASSNSDFIIRCLELGANDYTRIPVTANFLSWRLNKLLENSNTRLKQRIAKLSRHIKKILLADDVGLRIGKELNFEQYLEKFLVEVQGIYNADAGTVYIRTESDSLRFAIVRTNSLNIALGGTSGKEIDFPTLALHDSETGEANHHNVASHVAHTGDTVNIDDIYENEDFDFSGTRWFDEHNHYRSVSTLTVPLKDYNNFVIGVVQLINAQNENGRVVPFDDSQQMIVEALCAHTAVILSNYRLLKKQDMLSKIENDLKIGRQIQRDFMPAKIPEFEGWQLAARFLPAREVAGDFYDIFELDGFIVLIIADVCDKGVGAALFMALIRSLLRAFISQSREQILALPHYERTEEIFVRQLKRVVESTNDYILQHHYELNMFATLFAAFLNKATGRMVYINAGHTPEPMLLRYEREITHLRPTGPAVGMFEDAAFNVGRLTIAPDELLLALTDGVTDIQNGQEETLGIKAVTDLLQNSTWRTINDLMKRFEDLLLNYKADSEQYDDITLWMIYRNRK